MPVVVVAAEAGDGVGSVGVAEMNGYCISVGSSSGGFWKMLSSSDAVSPKMLEHTCDTNNCAIRTLRNKTIIKPGKRILSPETHKDK